MAQRRHYNTIAIYFKDYFKTSNKYSGEIFLVYVSDSGPSSDHSLSIFRAKERRDLSPKRKGEKFRYYTYW